MKQTVKVKTVVEHEATFVVEFDGTLDDIRADPDCLLLCVLEDHDADLPFGDISVWAINDAKTGEVLYKRDRLRW